MTDKEIRSGEDSIVQRQAEKAVRERQTRFRRISAITSDIAYSCHTKKDGRFSIDWMTGAADRVTGYSIEEIKAHGCWRFLVVEEDIPLFEKNVIGLAPGSRGSCELRIRHKNGGVVWISSFAECVAEAKTPGRLLLYGGLAEITERKQVEEKLSASEARYRRLFEAARDGIFILDADTGMITNVNSFLTEMLGFSREEFLGKHIWDLGFFKGIVANEADFLKLRQKEYIRYEDVSLETADARHINVEFVSNLYPVGQNKVIQCSIRRAHPASFPAQDPSPVVEVGIDGAVRFSNPAAMATLARLGPDPDARQFLPGTPEELALLRSQCERNPQTQELRFDGETFLRVVTAPPGGDSLHVYVLDITERKQAEGALRESENKYRLLIDTASESIVVAQDGLLKFVNPAALDLLGGYSEQEVINRPFPEFIHPDDRSMVVENYRRRMAKDAEQLPRYAFRVVTRDGIVKWVEINATLIEWQGKPATLNFLAEITDRKQAEEALLQARDDWESTFDSLTDMVTIHDKNYDIIRANSSARQMLGLPLLGNLITKAKCFMCYHGTEKPPEGCPSCRSLVTEQPCSFELFEPHLNRYLEIRAIPRFDTHHQCIGLVHVVRDITERKRAEEEILRERAFFDRLVESAPEGIAITDTQGRVMRVNTEFVRMFGYGVDEAVGQSIDDLVVPPARQEEARELTKSAGQGGEILLDTVRRRKDGSLIDVSVIAAPILITGKQEAVYVIYRDNTERRRAEAQLRQSQKMEAIGTLAGGVAHDFNNLLAGILGNIALMRSSLPPADPLLENLNAAETSARHAADLTKGLLTFSRSATVLPVPINITAALDATLVLLKQSLPATMEIVRDDDQAAWTILLDQSQMTQILLNLAINARDAMKGKGTLTIRTRNEVVEEDYVRNHPFARTGEFVHLSVTDTGPGMSSEVMQHLFEPFYTTKPIGSGTGLGLSIVYGAVKQAGGWITAGSTEGVGTTFDIYLPRCLEEPTQSFTPSPLPVNVGSGTVLVVEDEPVVRAVAQALLTRSGYTVLTALDGASALNVLHEHLADIGLILLDMTMPGMTSGVIVQAIRALDPTVPILLNSGYTSNGAVNQMLAEHSVQGFLGKPYDLPQLLENVQRLLRRG